MIGPEYNCLKNCVAIFTMLTLHIFFFPYLPVRSVIYKVPVAKYFLSFLVREVSIVYSINSLTLSFRSFLTLYLTALQIMLNSTLSSFVFFLVFFLSSLCRINSLVCDEISFVFPLLITNTKKCCK